jgi:hypothetical protein
VDLSNDESCERPYDCQIKHDTVKSAELVFFSHLSDILKERFTEKALQLVRKYENSSLPLSRSEKLVLGWRFFTLSSCDDLSSYKAKE